MPHDPKVLQSIVEAAAPPDLDLAFKSMFGGIMAYADGKPFCSLSDVGLGLKMENPADHKALLAVDGARPLQYEPGAPVSKTYVVVPDDWLHDKDTLRAWIVRSVAKLKVAKSKKKTKTVKD